MEKNEKVITTSIKTGGKNIKKETTTTKKVEIQEELVTTIPVSETKKVIYSTKKYTRNNNIKDTENKTTDSQKEIQKTNKSNLQVNNNQNMLNNSNIFYDNYNEDSESNKNFSFNEHQEFYSNSRQSIDENQPPIRNIRTKLSTGLNITKQYNQTRRDTPLIKKETIYNSLTKEPSSISYNIPQKPEQISTLIKKTDFYSSIQNFSPSNNNISNSKYNVKTFKSPKHVNLSTYSSITQKHQHQKNNSLFSNVSSNSSGNIFNSQTYINRNSNIKKNIQNLKYDSKTQKIQPKNIFKEQTVEIIDNERLNSDEYIIKNELYQSIKKIPRDEEVYFKKNKPQGLLDVKLAETYRINEPIQMEGRFNRQLNASNSLGNIILSSKEKSKQKSKSANANNILLKNEKVIRSSRKIYSIFNSLLKKRSSINDVEQIAPGTRLDKGGVVDFYLPSQKKTKYTFTKITKFTRYNEKKYKEAAIIIQKWWRRIVKLYRKINKYIILIQSVFRGYLIRKYIKKYLKRRKKTTITTTTVIQENEFQNETYKIIITTYLINILKDKYLNRFREFINNLRNKAYSNFIRSKYLKIIIKNIENNKINNLKNKLNRWYTYYLISKKQNESKIEFTKRPTNLTNEIDEEEIIEEITTTTKTNRFKSKKNIKDNGEKLSKLLISLTEKLFKNKNNNLLRTFFNKLNKIHNNKFKNLNVRRENRFNLLKQQKPKEIRINKFKNLNIKNENRIIYKSKPKRYNISKENEINIIGVSKPYLPKFNKLNIKKENIITYKSIPKGRLYITRDNRFVIASIARIKSPLKTQSDTRFSYTSIF